MTRSRKRTPIGANTCAESDKTYKVAEHRRERAAVRDALRNERDAPHPKTFGNPWKGEKDGKHWWSRATAAFFRK